MKIIKALLLLMIFQFYASFAMAMVEADMEEVTLQALCNDGMAKFNKGIWKIGDRPDFEKLAELEKTDGPLKIFAVDGIGVLYLNSNVPVGERAGCYTLSDLDRILAEKEKEERRRKIMEREAFFGEKSV